MADSYSFAVAVVGCIGERLSAKAAEVGQLAGTAAIDGWLVGEAYLACKGRQESYPFCEVEAAPTYASEGVAGEGEVGGLRVGGPDGGADHCWLFAEYVVVGHEGWQGNPTVVAAADRLKRLGWKKSAALLIAVTVNRDGVSPAGAAWDRPALTAPVVIPFAGGQIVLTAFDIKREPADTLTGFGR